MHDSPTPLPALRSTLRRSLVPPPGGSARLAQTLAAATNAPRASRLRPALAAAAALAMVAVMALPLRTAVERHDVRQQMEVRLAAAVAEAGRLGPEVRIHGASVQRLPSRVPSVRVYRVEPQGH